jgi:signal transduction histidine kinase
LGLVCSLRETTKYKQAELALRDAEQKAARRKDEFLAMLGHELRNPLAPIRNAAYVLEHADPSSERAARARGVLRRQSEHLTRLVEDLLEVTRITRGKMSLQRSLLDLREAVVRAAEGFRLMMADRGIAFRTALPEAAVWADADATRKRSSHGVGTGTVHRPSRAGALPCEAYGRQDL